MSKTQEMANMGRWHRLPVALVVLGTMLCAPLAAWAQNTIQSITSTQQAGTEVIRVELSEALSAVPAGFSVQAPPRVAIDLPGVNNGLGRNTVEINQGNLRSVSVAQAGERTRLVLNLKQAANFKAQLQGKALLVILEQTGAAIAAAAPPAHLQARRYDGMAHEIFNEPDRARVLADLTDWLARLPTAARSPA